MDVSDWFVAKLIFPWVIISQVFHYARWLTHPLLEGCRPCIKGRGRKNIFWLAAKFFLVNLAAIFFAQFAVLWFRISWSLNLCKKKSMVSFVFRLSSYVTLQKVFISTPVICSGHMEKPWTLSYQEKVVYLYLKKLYRNDQSFVWNYSFLSANYYFLD